MNRTSNFSILRETLGEYIDFDFADELSPPKRKRDGNFYATYIAELQAQYATLARGSRTVVIKELSPKQAEIYHQLSSIWHPNLETIYGVLPVGDFFISLNEFISKPSGLFYPTEELKYQRTLSLEEYIQNFGCFSEKQALIFMIQLCEGLETLSRLHLVHGDISPQNILLTDRHSFYPDAYPKINGLHRSIILKIIDFDITRMQKAQNHLVTAVEGTNPYAAPEILDYKTPTDRVDIYSLGCVLSFMLTGKSPKQDIKKNLDGQYSHLVKRIIEKCTSDYNLRYKNVTQLKQALAQQLSPHSVFRMIPGFRSGHPLRMCIATVAYCCLLLLLVFTIIPDPELWPWIPALILSVTMLFDIFHLGERFPIYVRYRENYPWLRYIVKLIFGIAVPFFLLGFLQSL